jgi:hypothetical protein
MEMVRNMKYTMILIALSVSAFAGDFTLAIGSPVAASLPGAPTTSDGTPVQVRKVNALFAVRTENCADPANALISATAESVVNGVRQSAAIRLVAGSGPGVYLVPGGRPTQGGWLVRLLGSCGSARAGALVPIGPGGFIRESSKFFSRLVTEADIEASLKSLSGGAK